MTKQNFDKGDIKRSVLYVPGSNEKALTKIPSLNADVYILDLEDAVAPKTKDIARELVCEFIRNHPDDNVTIRINSLNSEWGSDDLEAILRAGAKKILLPKVETPQDILNCVSLIGERDIELWAMIETPLGVLNAHQIARADNRLACLVLGTSDLVNDLRAAHSPDRLPVLYSLSHCILAARAAGLDILDGVHLDLNDNTGFDFSCKQGKELGFDGKTLIHPKQIDATNSRYSPSEKEINDATRIIEAFDQALSTGQGICVLDGKLIENLHVENARRILHMADIIKK